MHLPRLSVFVVTFLVLSACTTLKTPVFAPENKAIRGYDPVGYFVSGEPRLGKPDHFYKEGNVIWYFENAENRTSFIKHPEKYTPQYGGYCAYAMSKGFVVSTDPQAWTIEDDRLFLNYSLGVRKTWLKDTDGYILRADKNWSKKNIR